MPAQGEFDDIARMLTERILGAVQTGGSPFTPEEPAEDASRPQPQGRQLPVAPPLNMSRLYRSQTTTPRRKPLIDMMTLTPLLAMAFAVVLKVGPGVGVDLLEEFSFALSFVRVLMFVGIILGVMGIYLKPAITKMLFPPSSRGRAPPLDGYLAIQPRATWRALSTATPALTETVARAENEAIPGTAEEETQ